MSTIFQTQPGIAVAFPTTGDLPIPLAFDGFGGSSFFAYKSLITQLSVERAGNFQFIHTLKDLIHLYVFGNRISQIRVAGVCFVDRCPGNGGQTGVELISQYWDNNSVSRRSTPITMQLGTSPAGTFIGFLTNMRIDILQPESRLAQFAFIFHTLPQKK